MDLNNTAQSGFHLEINFQFGVEGGVAVSRTVSTPLLITIIINFWGVAEVLHGFNL